MKKRNVKKTLAMLTGLVVCAFSSGGTVQASEVKFYDGHRYEVHDDTMKWNDAKMECEKNGGHLVTITSAGEQSYVEEIILEQNMDNYWIGLYRHGGQKWWVTGENFSYQNIEFENGDQPFFGMYRTYNEAREREAAAGKWYDHDDTLRGDLWDYTRTGYICEWDTTPMSYADISLKGKKVVYDGKAKKPKVTVRVGDDVLEKDRDYTVKYTNNKKAGIAKVTITGKGCYVGAVTKKFQIVK